MCTCRQRVVARDSTVDCSDYRTSARLPSVEQDRGELVEERSEGLLEQRHAALAGRMLVRVRVRARVRVWVWVRARARVRVRVRVRVRARVRVRVWVRACACLNGSRARPG